MFSPEYDDPANMGDEYGSQYGQYGAPYEQYESRASMAGRSIGTNYKLIIILQNIISMLYCSSIFSYTYCRTSIVHFSRLTITIHTLQENLITLYTSWFI